MSFSRATPRAGRIPRRVLLLAGLGAIVIAIAGCSTGAPKPLVGLELTEAETFPYYKVYWVGKSFEKWPLAAADGEQNYQSSIGDSVYYGNCVSEKGKLGGGNCELPLQVTTLVYSSHSNRALGGQKNVLIRGVPATVYDNGDSIELYTGRLAIDVFSNTYARAIKAAEGLYPINAPGSPAKNLPLPVYCPGLYGPQPTEVETVMHHLPREACQTAEATLAYDERIKGQEPKSAEG